MCPLPLYSSCFMTCFCTFVLLYTCMCPPLPLCGSCYDMLLYRCTHALDMCPPLPLCSSCFMTCFCTFVLLYTCSICVHLFLCVARAMACFCTVVHMLYVCAHFFLCVARALCHAFVLLYFGTHALYMCPPLPLCSSCYDMPLGL
jgi:hypothetical protein